MAVNTWCLTLSNELPPRLPKIHNQWLLTLQWRSFSRWCRVGTLARFAYEGGQEFHYDIVQSIGSQITQPLKTQNHWHSIDAEFKVLNGHCLLASIIADIMISTLPLPFCPIWNQPVGKAETRNHLEQTSLILPKLIYPFEYGFSPAIDFFRNKYSHVTAQHSPVIYL